MKSGWHWARKPALRTAFGGGGQRPVGSPIRFGQERHGMDNAQGHVALLGAIDNLEEAAWIARGDYVGAGRLDVLELPIEQFVGHLWLNDVVDAGAPAAPRAFGQFDQAEIGNRAQELPGLRGNLLAMAKMARLVIGDRLRGRMIRGGQLESDMSEPFVNVLYLGVP